MQERQFRSEFDDEISFWKLWEAIVEGRIVILIVALILAIGATTYSVLATEWYQAEVVLAPADNKSPPAFSQQLVGLAALAGVGVDRRDVSEAIATLQSRDFTRSFIEDRSLLNVFFANEWDARGNKWRGSDPAEWPDSRDGIAYFRERILKVTQDQQSDLVTLVVEWKDPVVAADWANDLVGRLNAKLRQQALRETEINMKYLQSELANTSIVTLQQSIGRLLESEFERLMIARGNEQFAFQIVDTAEVPKYPVRPQRALIVAIGTLLGFAIGVFAVLVRRALRQDRRATAA